MSNKKEKEEGELVHLFTGTLHGVSGASVPGTLLDTRTQERRRWGSAFDGVLPAREAGGKQPQQS